MSDEARAEAERDHIEHFETTEARWQDCLEGECDHVDEDGQPEDMSACPSLTLEICVDCMTVEHGPDQHEWDDVELIEWPCKFVSEAARRVPVPKEGDRG